MYSLPLISMFIIALVVRVKIEFNDGNLVGVSSDSGMGI